MALNNTLSAFTSLNAAYDAATAETGISPWPTEGVHENFVIGIDASTEGVTFRQNDGQEFPAIRIVFQYQLVDDPERATPLRWNGAAFVIPLDFSQLNANAGSTKRASIEMNRLKGHLSKLIGEELPLDAAMIQLEKLLASDKALIAKVNCQYRNYTPTNPDGTAGQTRTFRTEYIQEMVSAPGA